MKTFNVKFLFSFLFISLLFSACKKDDRVVSKPTFWPNIVMKGNSLTVVTVGSTYNDSSAIVTVNGGAVPFETTSDVDASTEGAYTVVYTAKNADGISASQTRTVLVVDSTAKNDDISGSFTRVGQAGSVINWAKDDDQPNTYHANNMGGVAPSNSSYAVFNAMFVAYYVAPGIVVVPSQDLGAIGVNYCTNSTGGNQIPFNTTAASGDVAYQWVCIGPNFGTSLRTFKKI